MRRLERSVLLPYTCDDVYGLVNDVERYPEFLKWCKEAHVIDVSGDAITANIVLSARGRTESLVTRNTLEPGRAVTLDLVEGPFEHFTGRWTFEPLGKGCKVHLWLEFEIKNAVLGALLAPLVNRFADVLVDAFSHRAKAVLVPSV